MSKKSNQINHGEKESSKSRERQQAESQVKQAISREQLETYIKADCRAAIYFLSFLNSRPEILSAIAEMMEAEQNKKPL